MRIKRDFFKKCGVLRREPTALVTIQNMLTFIMIYVTDYYGSYTFNPFIVASFIIILK